MSYATQQDMVSRFGNREMVALTDRDNTGVIDASVLSGGLTAADNEINVYLAGRYDLPLASTPTIVRDFACDIARYRLCSSEVTETKEIRDRYKDAVAFFTKVSRGEISLGLNALQQPIVATAGGVKSISSPGVFTDEALDGY
ncbi:DUF1320 domain-containing protein [Methylophilus sp. YYY-1]|uniref:gp436 family protein n=1 Tax=Methylophilus sp. YYY-1 TaxID=2682087 RepID=UPI0023B3562A|nr:DUF1320 domain-containing protein [Methylophilus sp. YYY-1]MDF0377693.1 DUF1320 domain-containing protein [Methylophilus sp. YYY-1]